MGVLKPFHPLYLQRGPIFPHATTEEPKTSTGVPAVTKKCYKQLPHQILYFFILKYIFKEGNPVYISDFLYPYCKELNKDTHLHYNHEHKELTSQHEGHHCSKGDPTASASEREFQLIITIMDKKWTQRKSFVSFEYFCNFDKSQNFKT